MSLLSSGERQKSFGAAFTALLVAVASPSVSQAAEQGLLLMGYNASFSGGMPMGQEEGISSQSLCGSDGISGLQTANQAVLDRLSQRLGNVGVPTLASMEGGARTVQSELCQGGEGFNVEPAVITYSSCRMTMDQQSVLTDMRLPSGGAEGAMEVAELWEASVMRVPLYPSEGESSSAGGGGGMSWTGPGDTRQIAGYPATRWDYKYSAKMGVGGAGGMSMNVKTDGHGYFSNDVPGIAIAKDFFERFSQGTSFKQGGGSFFDGMMKTWVEVLDRGLPMEMDQTVASSMMGMGGDYRSIMKVTSVHVVDLPEDFCTRALTPDYFEVTEMGEGMSGVTFSPGDGESDGEEEAGGAMSGLGSLFEMMKSGQQQGLAIPGQQQAPAANPAGQPAAQAPAGTASAASAGPSSADLTTGNMTQSVQKHLQALGYDVGNTKGDLDTTTVISISQFQAEKGMDVTGEVSPQLLGILGAEVDSR